MEKGSGDNLPVAYATAVSHPEPSVPPASASGVAATNIGTAYEHELPPGNSGGDIQLTGCPVQIGKGTDPFLDIPVGLYVHSIQIGPNLEISHLNDPGRVQQLLESSSKVSRRLYLNSKPPQLSPYDGFYYCHTLPAPLCDCSLEALGITLTGFNPPRITSVAATSPLAGTMHPHQAVVAVHIPGKWTLNEHTPGFTAYRIQQELQGAAAAAAAAAAASSSKKVDGRIQIVVKDEKVRFKQEKGSNDPISDCRIL